MQRENLKYFEKDILTDFWISALDIYGNCNGIPRLVVSKMRYSSHAGGLDVVLAKHKTFPSFQNVLHWQINYRLKRIRFQKVKISKIKVKHYIYTVLNTAVEQDRKTNLFHKNFISLQLCNCFIYDKRYRSLPYENKLKSCTFACHIRNKFVVK